MKITKVPAYPANTKHVTSCVCPRCAAEFDADPHELFGDAHGIYICCPICRSTFRPPIASVAQVVRDRVAGKWARSASPAPKNFGHGRSG